MNKKQKCNPETAHEIYNSDFAILAGLSIMILAICLGIGGCCYLIDKGEVLRDNTNPINSTNLALLIK